MGVGTRSCLTSLKMQDTTSLFRTIGKRPSICLVSFPVRFKFSSLNIVLTSRHANQAGWVCVVCQCICFLNEVIPHCLCSVWFGTHHGTNLRAMVRSVRIQGLWFTHRRPLRQLYLMNYTIAASNLLLIWCIGMSRKHWRKTKRWEFLPTPEMKAASTGLLSNICSACVMYRLLLWAFLPQVSLKFFRSFLVVCMFSVPSKWMFFSGVCLQWKRYVSRLWVTDCD